MDRNFFFMTGYKKYMNEDSFVVYVCWTYTTFSFQPILSVSELSHCLIVEGFWFDFKPFKFYKPDLTFKLLHFFKKENIFASTIQSWRENVECVYDCRYTFFSTKNLLLPWKSTATIAKESFLAFMRMWGYCVTPITSQLVSIYGMHYLRIECTLAFYLVNFYHYNILDLFWLWYGFLLPLGPTMKNL